MMPNQKWVTDITYIRTGEGFLYLCIVKDLFFGSIVGWSMSAVGSCADQAKLVLTKTSEEMG